ncbi:MAG: hypothetical protein IRY85_20780, partial [Micromonosporaceae bacterium]|nr:hypothetical protein [Micromonosporaceae bacterium]
RWHAEGRLVTDDRGEQEGFAFLCALDPVFSLRFDDGSTITVNVQLLDNPSQFELTEYTGPAQRQLSYTIDSRPPAEPAPNDPPNTKGPNII